MLRALSWPFDLADRAVMWFVRHVPGTLVAMTIFGLYPGLGLILPLWFGWPRIWLIDANVIGVSFGFVLVLAWFLGLAESTKKLRVDDQTANLRMLSGDEFEWLVGTLFERDGWKVTHTGKQDSYDGNIDLELTKGREHKVVQCKAWQKWQVDVDDVRAFGGTLLRKSLPGEAGIFVTLSDFTRWARKEARETGLRLIDGTELIAMMDKTRRSEPCPICHQPMRLGRSAYGWWFRCVQPGCKGKRDVGSDAGRAVGFLTESH